MNPNEAVSLFSSDIFDRVDDPKNHLKSCITPELMNRFTKAGAPPHELRLKVDDICIVLRNLSKRNGLSNNVSNFTQFPTSVVTFDKSVVDVTHEPFCHGQLYVAVSRVRESDNIFLFCRDTQILEQCGGVLLTNIVYPSLLLSQEDFYIPP